MADTNPSEVTIEFLPNGPMLVKGSFTLTEAGVPTKKNGPVALCRCGHSKKKPYCDGSHKASDFKS
jgi:CDGSH iron-sulfur domain-containing protein 3